MVAPIGVDDPQLGQGGVPMLLVPEILLAEEQVGEGHGKAHGAVKLFHLPIVPAGKALNPGHIRRVGAFHCQRGGLVHRGLPALHRVDQVRLHPGKVLLAAVPL